MAFQATLEPDGQGGHWLKVDRKLREAAGAEAGDVVTLEIAPMAEEPEPRVPADLRKALAAAHPKARRVWSDITPIARRDWIHWIGLAKQEETRAKSDQNCLRHARQRKATPLLLRSVWDVCQEPQLPRSGRHVKVTPGRAARRKCNGMEQDVYLLRYPASVGSTEATSHARWKRDGPNTAGEPTRAGSDEATHHAGRAGQAADRQSITRASWLTRSELSGGPASVARSPPG